MQERLKIIEGNNIYAIAPSSGFPKQILEKLTITNKNKNIYIPENSFREGYIYLSNSDDNRFKILKNALKQNNYNIIWCLKGGYGSARIVERLYSLKRPKKEKIFIGYSDITAIHLFLSQEWGWRTIHGSMLSEIYDINKDSKNFIYLNQIINGIAFNIELTPINNIAENVSIIKGSINGGHMDLLNMSIKTKWEIKPKEILFLEVNNKKGYQLDFYLTHFLQAGIFHQIKALVIGDLVPKIDIYVDYAVNNFASNINIPVFKTSCFGHGKKNYPIMYNANYQIMKDIDNSYTMKMII